MFLKNLSLKKEIQRWWNSSPCCSKATNAQWGTKQFYEHVDLYKDTYEPFVNGIADYATWNGKNILEIGVGVGKDFSRFASAGAAANGVDISFESLRLTKKRLEIFGLKGNLCLADAEQLPFKGDAFDLVFSWGALHHTPGTQAAVNEVYRCLKPNSGKLIVMLYNKKSILNIYYTVLSFFSFNRPGRFAALTDGAGNPFSKAYSSRDALGMFSKFRNVKIQSYEAKKSPFAKIFNFFKILEKYFGWFMVIKAQK